MRPALEWPGAWTALVTPLDARGGPDLAAYRRLIEFQAAEGIRGVVPAGTTGESPTLSWDEHILFIEAALTAGRGKILILAGAGSNCTDESVAAARHVHEAGADGALLVDCYYNGPSSLELRTEYYERILQEVPEIPLVPYIIPGRTGCALGAEDLAILHRACPQRLPAVKQATGDLERMRRDRALAGPALTILSGDDDLTLTMMQDPRIACTGVVSVMSNIVPGAVARMVACQRRGEAARAQELNGLLTPLFKLVAVKCQTERQLADGRKAMVEDRFRNPVPIKTMMGGLGLPGGPVRRPLGKMPPAGVAACRDALRQVFRAAPELLRPLQDAFGVDVERRLADDSAWAAVTRS